MSMVLPPPDEVRAIVVGIERYPGLGPSFDAPGAVAGALAFASWLINERRVRASDIDLWLSLRDASDVREACKAAGLADATVHDFAWSNFRAAMEEPAGVMLDGRFLIVYFCGHGVVSGARGEQYLVLPEASEKQFRCFEALNWRQLFRGSGWERYGHQLWIIDACRNQWGEAMRPVPDEWNPGEPKLVHQCAMFACAAGGTAAIDSKAGPRFTRELLTTLTRMPANGGWPAFDAALQETASRLRADPALGQSPTLSIGEDWFGTAMVGPGLAGAELHTLLATIAWPYARFKPYVMRARAATSIFAPQPADLKSAIEQLHEAAPVDGVPPLVDFAERVARAVPSPMLHEWVTSRLAPQRLAELAARLDADIAHACLSLWYRDDGAQPCIEGELDVLDAGGGVRAWPRAQAKLVTTGDVGKTIGEWMQEVYEHVGSSAINLVVELYLPRALLTATAYDTAIVPLTADEELRLGEDHPALLRCTDRYKGPTKLSRLRKHAPAILARLSQAPADRLRWTVSGESSAALRTAFIVESALAPVWLGFDPAECGNDAPLDVALAEGLPAVVWLRANTSEESLKALRSGLQELLKSPLNDLPARLVTWRSKHAGDAGRSLSLLLDDPARLPAMWASWTQPGG